MRHRNRNLTRRILAVCVFLALGAVPSFADVSGSPLLEYGNFDGCSGCVFPYVQFTAANAGQTVISYSFYATAVPTNYPSFYSNTVASNSLTPILFQQTSSDVFTILGIGSMHTGFTPGAIVTEPFGLQLGGSATVLGANTFFGYVDGSADGTVTNHGTISMDYQAGIGPGQYYYSNPAGQPLAVGEDITMSSMGAVSGIGPRTYALEVTTTPEPGFYGLLALGLSGLGVFARRRRSRS